MTKNKFRIWDKKYKAWADPHCWRLNAQGEIVWNRLLNSPNGQEDFVIQQFTGAVDMKGREIYEGDILLSDSGDKSYVKWEPMQFMSDNFSFQEFDANDKPQSHYGCIDNPSLFKEVIGNVFENPELLIK